MATAFEIPGFSWSRVAGEDLSDSQYCGVDLASDGEVVLPVEGGRGVGVVRNKPIEGDAVTLVSDGITFGKIGVTGVGAGDNVTVDDDGTFIQASSGDVAWGRSLQAHGPGEVGSILLQMGSGNIVASS